MTIECSSEWNIPDTLEIRHWLLEFGAQVEVIAPESLRKEMEATITQMSKRYTPNTRRYIRRYVFSPDQRGMTMAKESQARLLEKALNAKYVVISVMGPYAKENEHKILIRKIREIHDCKYTFWHHQSHFAPEMVQELGAMLRRENEAVYFVLIKGAKGRSGVDTNETSYATHYKVSPDGRCSQYQVREKV